jgi:hypothetical protein
MATINTADRRLTHEDVRRACGAAGSANEMTCPCCGHAHLQLFGEDGIKCQNGCSTETLAAEIRRRLDTGEVPASAGTPKPKKLKPSQLPTWQGFTLSDYCKLKGLDARVLGVLLDTREVSYRGKTVVGWPYYDDAGALLATKLRLSTDSHDTLFNPADPHVPYGLNNPHLQNLVSGTYDLFITEGESDCQTLCSYSYLAIGISGSEGWLPEYADLPVIEQARRVFVCEDQDAGGKTFAAKVLRTLPQAFVLRPEGIKDINELHLKYIDFDADEIPWTAHPFIQCIDIAIQAATLEKAMRQPKAAKPKPTAMRDEAFHGVAGELVALLEPVLETDRASILSNVLACAGVLFQRAAHYKVTADTHYPADYFLTVGNSAISRKGTTTNAVLDVIERVQGGFKQNILHGLSTGQGLIAALIKPQAEGKEEGDDGIEALPEPIAASVLIEISEFAELLAVMKREENTLSAVMRDAWDGKPMGVLTRKDPLKVQNVSLSTIAHITRRELLDRLTSTDRANGFANRFLFVWTQRVKLLPNCDMGQLDCNVVVAKLHAAVEAAQGAGGLKRDYETEAIWEEEYKRLTTRGETMTDALLSRAEAHVVRLSLLYALLDSARVIRKEHLRAALAFWDYCEESVRYVFGDAADPDYSKILSKLEFGPLTTGEVRRIVFGDHKASEWVAEKLAALKDLRKVRVGDKQLKTKTVDAWFLVEYQP